MIPVSINDIYISPERQRREFDTESLVDLSQSIQSKGLMHAVVVREALVKDDDGQQRFRPVLVAGERRLRAMQMLIDLEIPILHNGAAYLGGSVPVVYLSDLSDLDAFEAELEENILRKDLTWQERSQAVSLLHNLRAEQSGGVQTLTDTAGEITGRLPTKQDIVKVHKDLIVAQHLSDPEVAKAPTRKEAFKIVERKLKAEHREVLAREFDLTKTKHTLHFGDAFDIIVNIPDESIDCILTDPPYGVDADNFGDNFNLTHDYEDGWELLLEISRVMSVEFYRVLKDNTHCYVFCSFEGWHVLARDFAAAGFRIWPQPLIWSKGNGNAPWLTQGHKRTYECILFASKGNREVNTVKNDVLTYSPVSDRDHGAEKPVALLADLLGRSTVPGNTILDAFVGSGSIFPAADIVSCRAIGFERVKDSYNIAITKLEPLL